MKDRIALGNSVFNFKSSDCDANSEDSGEFNDDIKKNED